MTNQQTNEEVRFTQVKEVEYNNEEMSTCFFWDPSTAFSKGKYDVEVYNKGYMAGKGSFTLK